VIETINVLSPMSAEKTRPRNLSSVFFCRSVVEKNQMVEPPP